MKLLFLIILNIILLSFLFTSCSPQFYAPTTAITPLFREKGEAQLSAHIGNGNEIDQSLQIQAAFAVDSNLAVSGTLYSAEGGYNKDEPQDQNYGKGSQLELAIGYFTPITSKLSYELYGGFAIGKVSNHFLRTYASDNLGTTSFPYQIDNNCFKPFVQGNIGYRSHYFDAIVTIRTCYLHIGQIKETAPNLDPSYKTQLIDDANRIQTEPNSFLLEPGLTLRAGYEPLKLQLHLGWSINSNGSAYPQEEIIFSAGLVGMINSSTQKRKSPSLNF
jgi:hypothetical protein